MYYEGDLRCQARLYVKAAGTAPVKKIEIIRDGKVISIRKGKKLIEEFYFEDTPFKNPKSHKTPALEVYYYIRLTQEDEHMAWSSPVWCYYNKR